VTTQSLLTSLTYSDEEVQWPVHFAPDLTVTYVGKEIRRERTGVHALVLITIGTSVLAFDDFNVLRIPDRRRLAKAFMELLTDEQKTFILSAGVMHSLDLFCAYLGQQYETAHLEIDTVAADWTPQAVRFALDPYLLDGAGMVLFAPPGAAKSFIAQAMALSLSLGSVSLFHIPQPRPALYVNLERSGESMHTREVQIMAALSLRRPSGLEYLHARGRPLLQLIKRIKAWAREHADGVVFLDSVSRSGGGSLTEDLTANRFVDAMNSIGTTWVGIGHTGRAQEERLYGNIMFEAGVDVAVKLNSVRVDEGRIVNLEVTKANDIAFPKKLYLRLGFDNHGLDVIRHVNDDDMAMLKDTSDENPDSAISDSLMAFEGQATSTEIAQHSGISRRTVARHLRNRRDLYQVVKTEGRSMYYGLKARLPRDDY
jgi:hypothetical protein